MKKLILLFSAAWVCIWSAGNVSAETFGGPQMRRIAPKKIPAPRPHDAWDSTHWQDNTVNGDTLGASLYYADNMNYHEWQAYYKANKNSFGGSQYALAPLMRSRYLSTAAYSWRTDSTEGVNNSLSEESTPALVMYHPNKHGSTSLGKCITNIQRAADGTVSFTLESTSAPEGLESTPFPSGEGRGEASKILRDGMLLIEKNGRTYTLQGTEVR